MHTHCTTPGLLRYVLYVKLENGAAYDEQGRDFTNLEDARKAAVNLYHSRNGKSCLSPYPKRSDQRSEAERPKIRSVVIKETNSITNSGIIDIYYGSWFSSEPWDF